MQDVSLLTERFKEKIINLLNQSNFPPVIKYYVMKEIFSQMENEYQNYINLCLKREQEELKSMKEDENA